MQLRPFILVLRVEQTLMVGRKWSGEEKQAVRQMYLHGVVQVLDPTMVVQGVLVILDHMVVAVVSYPIVSMPMSSARIVLIVIPHRIPIITHSEHEQRLIIPIELWGK
jgi:hypothetical protein